MLNKTDTIACTNKSTLMKNRIPLLSLIGLTVILVFLPNTLAAQNTKADPIESNMFNNAIYGSVGNGGLYFTATAYYERMLKRNTQESKITTFVKAGFGGAAYWGGQSQYILGQFGILTGAKKHHLEVSAGFLKPFDNKLGSFPLSGSIGYRMQKPNSHFIFRTGLGWPEALNIGCGLSF